MALTTLYRYYDADDQLLYVGVTSAGARRSEEHHRVVEWWPRVARATMEHYEDRPSALKAEAEAIRQEQPACNVQSKPPRVERPMPFTYFGTKASLAKHYRPPMYNTIVEPFAGAAGYAVHWYRPHMRVLLIEKDPHLVALWARLQAPDAAEDLMSIQVPPLGEKCKEPLIGGSDLAFFRAMRGLEFQVTTRMVSAWPVARMKILRALPTIANFEVIEGDYSDAPDIRATWFIDPPYWKPPDSLVDARGGKYNEGADNIDYEALGVWCQGRRGQIMVCEQEGATWLPFRPFRVAPTLNTKQRRMEVIWEKVPGSALSTPRSKQLAQEARDRKKARRG